ncbi:carboxypeptidase-like regulatory domain-containing protein [Fluviibacterium sp. DFM31]|uniref:Carboxypeptidase-like regulatory domain-containing protein n=1 Tax=Meridianimarinicoccus marinus TaxID=3231483 RepID=A0ABV3LAN9_9RHOB
MVLKAYAPPMTRQAVATGRLAQGVTGFALPVFEAELHYEDPGAADRWLPYPAVFRRGDGGWFSFQLDPQSAAPAFEAVDPLRLRVTFAVPGREPFEETRTIPGADLRPTQTSITVVGDSVQVTLLPGAPVDFSGVLDPLPVALAGYVLRDNDSETPAPNATVSILAPVSATTATTDAGGWFRLDALPVAEEVTVRATDGLHVTDRTIRIDFNKPVNETILSVTTT